MRQKRAKTYKKLMKLYSRSFGFRQPYQVLVDSTFCTYAAQNKIDIPKQLGVVLQGQQKQMITQCSMVELYNLGPSHQAVVDMAKTFERRKCNHREAIPNDDCIKSVVGNTNKHRYVVATQSQPLRVSLRAIPSVPIVHINRVVMVLEPPSDTTLRAKALQEADAQAAKPTELAAIASTTPVAESSEPPRKKRKGPKEPNPLSVKKKKPKAPQGSTATATKPSTSKTSHHATLQKAGSDVTSKKRKRDAGGDDEAIMEDDNPPLFATSVAAPSAAVQDEDIPVDVIGHVKSEGEGDPSRSRKRRKRRKGPAGASGDPSEVVEDDAESS